MKRDIEDGTRDGDVDLAGDEHYEINDEDDSD